jgi:DNA-binding winged helix-turn-helix (wHTH) protein/Flp pilus assembly protein TadD
MKEDSYKNLQIDKWRINVTTGELCDTQTNLVGDERIDPLGIKLLVTLAEHNGELVAKDVLFETLWSETIVTDEALSRCVSRLRKLLGDNPRHPNFIETLPKRGYRLIAKNVQWLESSAPPTQSTANKKLPTKILITITSIILLLVVMVSFYVMKTSLPETSTLGSSNTLIQQADDYYHNINRQDNEMAIELYQQVLALSPDSVSANSGLANALVQRAIRMPIQTSDAKWQDMSLSLALADGRLTRAAATLALDKANDLASKAVTLAPDDARAHKALGFVLSAQNQLMLALQSYQKALELNPDAWDVLINIGDINELSGRPTDAIANYKLALNAMHKEEPGLSNRGRPWRASLGSSIGDKYVQQNNLNEAELWYRHVLSFAPYDGNATRGLSQILALTSRTAEAKRLCQEYQERIGQHVCEWTN